MQYWSVLQVSVTLRNPHQVKNSPFSTIWNIRSPGAPSSEQQGCELLCGTLGVKFWFGDSAVESRHKSGTFSPPIPWCSETYFSLSARAKQHRTSFRILCVLSQIFVTNLHNVYSGFVCFFSSKTVRLKLPQQVLCLACVHLRERSPLTWGAKCRESWSASQSHLVLPNLMVWGLLKAP